MLPGCYKAGWERQRFNVCGRRLHPFTLGHARVLYLAESPFVVSGSGEITVKDLLLAVAICARPFAPQHNELIGLASEGLVMKSPDLAADAKKFGDYLSYWMSRHPRFADGEQEQHRIPWPWLFACILQTEYGMSDDCVWHITTADALWRIAALATWRGSKEYATLDDLAIDELWGAHSDQGDQIAGAGAEDTHPKKDGPESHINSPEGTQNG